MRILFVENHDAFARTVVEAFLGDHEVEVVPDIASATSRVTSSHFHCILVDYDLDDGKGSDLVARIRAAGIVVPIIATSSHEHGNAELKAAGADEVCPKHQFHRLPRILQRMEQVEGGYDTSAAKLSPRAKTTPDEEMKITSPPKGSST